MENIRKFTDEEIIRALGGKVEAHCAVCETKEIVPCEHCIFHYVKNAVVIINRQKAEVERLTIDMNAARLGMIAEHERLKTAKAEAVKEFAERLKEEACYFGRAVAMEDIDNIAKELTGGGVCETNTTTER